MCSIHYVRLHEAARRSQGRCAPWQMHRPARAPGCRASQGCICCTGEAIPAEGRRGAGQRSVLVYWNTTAWYR